MKYTALIILAFSVYAQEFKLFNKPNVDQIYFALDSDKDGVCKVLGFAKLLEGSVTYKKLTSKSRQMLVDANGSPLPKAGSEYQIEQIICQGVNEEESINLEFEILENPCYPNTKVLISTGSDVNGVCKALGFDRHLYNSQEYQKINNSPMMVIDKSGRVTKAETNGYYFKSIVCYNL